MEISHLKDISKYTVSISLEKYLIHLAKRGFPLLCAFGHMLHSLGLIWLHYKEDEDKLYVGIPELFFITKLHENINPTLILPSNYPLKVYKLLRHSS